MANIARLIGVGSRKSFLICVVIIILIAENLSFIHRSGIPKHGMIRSLNPEKGLIFATSYRSDMKFGEITPFTTRTEEIRVWNQYKLSLSIIKYKAKLNKKLQKPISNATLAKMFCISESDLVSILLHGEASKQTIIRRNIGLVRYVAKGYKRKGVGYEDLVLEGITGLITAVEKFSHERGTAFSNYAIFWIRRNILRAIASQSQLIRLPEGSFYRFKTVQQAYSKLSIVYARPPTVKEVSSALVLPLQVVQDVMEHSPFVSSIDRIVYGQELGSASSAGRELRVRDQLKSGTSRPADAYEEKLKYVTLHRAVRALPVQEQAFLTLRYGLHAEGLTPLVGLRALARKLGSSRWHLQHLEERVMDTLAEGLGTS